MGAFTSSGHYQAPIYEVYAKSFKDSDGVLKGLLSMIQVNKMTSAEWKKFSDLFKETIPVVLQFGRGSFNPGHPCVQSFVLSERSLEII